MIRLKVWDGKKITYSDSSHSLNRVVEQLKVIFLSYYI